MKQSNVADPTLLALNFLKGDAAVWRDSSFLATRPTCAQIPWPEFMAAFTARFMTSASCISELAEFQKLKQGNRSVQEYTAVFRQKIADLSTLPHITVPDITAQAKQYMMGLRGEVQRSLKFKLTIADLSNLPLIMDVAGDSEDFQQHFDLLLGSPLTDDVRVQNLKRESSGVSHRSTSSPSVRTQAIKKGKHASRSMSSPSSGSVGLIPMVDQHPSKEISAKLPSKERLQQLRKESALNVQGPDNKLYPNRAYRDYCYRDNLVKNKCFGCCDIHGAHPRGQCPNPQVGSQSRKPARTALANADVCANTVAVPDLAAGREHSSRGSFQLAAVVHAQPYVGNTMLFVGAVPQQDLKGIKVLLDTGSSHSFCRPGLLLPKDHTGQKFNVTLADNSCRHAIPEGHLQFEVQGIACTISACEMPLPDGVDILLGQSWMQEHQAALLFASGQVNFMDDTNLPACWIKNENGAVAEDPFNSNLKWTSKPRPAKHKQMFVAFVRHSDQHATASCNAVNAVPEPDTAEPANVSSDRLNQLFVEQASAVQGIRQLVQEFADVFPEQLPSGLPPDRNISHAVPLQSGYSVPASKQYRLSKPQREEMEAQVKQLLAKGWIKPSSSPFGSPILFVKKKDGGMRMCVDYRAVNKLTVKNSYPLPRIDDLLDRLAGAKVFSCLDLQQAYHQVKLSPEDVPKTAFTTPMGLFEYMVLPFGLSNAPSTFQAVINSVLGPELSQCCLVYLDDIVVFSKSPEEHLKHLRAVLLQLQNAKLYAKLSKCRFALKAVKFLGHVVDEKGITPDPEKVQSVQTWPVPRDVHETRQFVGLAQYFRKFIQGFSTMIAPLTGLFKKGVDFLWSTTCQKSFEQVKEALTSAPCLKLPDERTPFTVTTDASGLGVGGVLTQEGRPVAFEGRRLTDTEKKWSATEQEMLGVVYHLEKWRCYLEGVHFTVITDHQPNTWFASQKSLSPRQARWYERLRGFDFAWQYRPGRHNVADPLSRNPAFQLHSYADGEHMCAMNLRSAGPPGPLPTFVHSDGRKRRSWDLAGVLKQAHDMQWGAGSGLTPQATAPLAAELPASKRQKGPAGEPLHAPSDPENEKPERSRPITPENLGSVAPASHLEESFDPLNFDGARQHGQFSDVQVPDLTGKVSMGRAGDPDHMTDLGRNHFSGSEASLAEHRVPDVSGGDAFLHVPLASPEVFLERIRGGYRVDPLFGVTTVDKRASLGITCRGDFHWKGSAIVVPDVGALHTDIIRELHCSPYAGHVGMNRTEKLISRYFYWPNMRAAVNQFVGGCVTCQRNKSSPGAKAGKLLPLPVPSGIWEDVSMDFVGPLPKTSRGHDFILVVVDRLSKMSHFLPCKKSISGPGTAQLYVDRIWSLHGLPKSIVTDRGSAFVNAFSQALFRLLGTRHAVSTAYHPETDGQTERVNRVLGEMLRHYTNWKCDDWDIHLPLVEFAHNNAQSSSTGMTPFFVCYGKHPLTPMSAVIEAANAAWEKEPQENAHFLKAHEFVKQKQDIVRMAQTAMESARQRMLSQEEGKRRELNFHVGDQVSLKTKHLGISTLPSRKLFQPWMGPFTVSKVINPVAYQLELPHSWNVHNVFHVSLLKPYRDNGEAVAPQSFTLIGDKANEFEVESIYDFTPKTLHSNGKQRKVSELTFWVKWRGQPLGEQARQSYQAVKGTASTALADLARKFKFPADLFEKASNRVPLIT